MTDPNAEQFAVDETRAYLESIGYTGDNPKKFAECLFLLADVMIEEGYSVEKIARFWERSAAGLRELQ